MGLLLKTLKGHHHCLHPEMAALPLGCEPQKAAPRPVSDVPSMDIYWRHTVLAADTQAGELRPGGCWDTRLTQDKARPCDWGPKGPWFKPQALSGCVREQGSSRLRPGVSLQAWRYSELGEGVASALCDLEQGSHQRAGRMETTESGPGKLGAGQSP